MRRLGLAEQVWHVICLAEVVLYVVVLRLIVELTELVLERAASARRSSGLCPLFPYFLLMGKKAAFARNWLPYDEERCFQRRQKTSS